MLRVMSLPSKSGVYAIKNLRNNKRLVLFAKDMKHNATYYFSSLDNNTAQVMNSLQNDYNLHSNEFTIELLEVTDNSERKNYYIHKYNSTVTGYNKKETTPKIYYNHLSRTPAIYCILNKTNGKRYIGKSLDVRIRVRDHFRDLVSNKHWIQDLQKDWNLGHSFESIILEYTENLNEREEYYILLYKSFHKNNGYNRNIGTKKYHDQ